MSMEMLYGLSESCYIRCRSYIGIDLLSNSINFRASCAHCSVPVTLSCQVSSCCQISSEAFTMAVLLPSFHMRLIQCMSRIT